MAIGFAVKTSKSGSIDVRTVSQTMLGAAVNWIVIYTGIVPQDYWSDTQVFALFDEKKAEHSIVKVEIKEIG